MYGELQEPRTASTVRVVRTFKQESGARSISHSSNRIKFYYYRFRRSVLEGTEEELLGGNTTSRGRRQAEFPGSPDRGQTGGK